MAPTQSRYLSAACTLSFLVSAALCHAQSRADKSWTILDSSVQQKDPEKRMTAVRVLGLVPNDDRATHLAEKALQDPKPEVRVAAATALGQMRASAAIPELKRALSDKNMKVVLAAAHALRLMHDPACYEVYYEILTGDRKSGASFVEEETEMLHDPKQLARIGFEEGIGYVLYAGIGWNAFETIRKNRHDGSPVKAAAATNLALDPDPLSATALVKATHDKNWVIRVAALEAIAKRGDPTLAAKIEDCLSDRKDEVQYTAAAVIAHLERLAETKKAAAVTESRP
jgi:HEAT repeat protein